MINSVVQIILSVFLIAIMAFISYSIYNNEMIKNITINASTKKQTKIFTGIFDYTRDKNINIETYDTTDKSYLDINPSINQNGGAEYSYNFWLFFNLSSDSTITGSSVSSDDSYKADGADGTTNYPRYDYRYINLFYKGEPNYIPINTQEYECNDHPNIRDNVRENIFIKNPLVKIRNDAKEIVVEYNNINFSETYNTNAIKLSCENTNDATKDINNRNKNKLGIKDIITEKYKQKFNMITIVFQEQPKNENIFNKNNANCKVYFNGVLVEDRLAHTVAIETDDQYNKIKSRVMKSNLSKLRINPTNYINTTNPFLNNKLTATTTSLASDSSKKIKISPLQMADLSYFNYALTVKEIKALYNKGFNTNIVTYISNISDDIKFQKGEYIFEKTGDQKTVKGI
jgi:hypothetical protein